MKDKESLQQHRLADETVASKTDMYRGHKLNIARVILALLVLISLSFVGGWLGAKYFVNSSSTRTDTQNAKRVVNEESQLISSIATEVGPSVVSIDVTSQTSSRDALTGEVLSRASAGTGFILSKDGYIITNRHVIPRGTSNVSVTLSDGTEFKDVEVVGRTGDSDPLDVAFLKIQDLKGEKLKPASLGDSDKMQVGDMVIAIGNALGQFQNTVTSGIVSGFGRSVEAEGGSSGPESLQNLFQTDAAINPGNSGGPLVNSDGEVIGINTAVAGNAENIGFSIPINDVNGLIEGILEKGRLLRPYLGVRYIQLTPGVADELKLGQQEGAYIPEGTVEAPSIIAGSPADEAGLRSGDIIIKINGGDITTTNSLSSVVGRFSVGEEVTISYIRNGREETVKTKITELP